MNNGRTGEVVEDGTEGLHHEPVVGFITEPAAAPSPMSFNGVDEQRYDSAVDDVHGEFGSFCHGSADNRCRGGTEDGLEHQETLYGQVAMIEGKVAPVGHADEACAVRSEHETKADEPEQQRAEHEVHEVLEQNVCGVLAAREACLAQGKARLHPENKHGCQQHPYGIE